MGKYIVRVLVISLIFLFGKNGIAQTSICGKVTDKDTGEEMIAANIVVTKNGNFIQGETTDIDGNYSIRIDAGIYDLEISYTGYATQKITGIPLINGQAKKVDVKLNSGQMIDFPIVMTNGCGRIPLIRHDENPNKLTLTSQKIRTLPTRNINQIITITPGVSFTQ